MSRLADGLLENTMYEPIVIQGHFRGQTFVPSEPLPNVEGAAQLIVFPAAATQKKPSIFDFFGKAPVLRSKEDIESQIREERDSWGDP
jgi:hypothetical protein